MSFTTMNRRLFAMMLFFWIRSALAAPPFTKTDWAYQAAATASMAADWSQTRQAARSGRYVELNPVLGPHPSAAEINEFFIGSAIVNAAIARMLPPPWRRAWQVGTIGLELVVVRQNASVGLHVRF